MKVLDSEIFVGCDPEVFIKDKKTGEFVPAPGIIPGTKEEPYKVKKGMVQVDGLALEFGIDPASNKEEFISNIKTVLIQLNNMLPKHLTLAFNPIAVFSEKDIKAQRPEDLELGCDPDYNAYTLEQNPRPTLLNPNMRSAGGHVHIGWGAGIPPLHPEHIRACAALTAEMDYRLGSTSLAWDSDNVRRSIYGAAGAFRPKPYGMEYRTLSNQWLLSEDTIGFVYDQTIKSVYNTITGKNNFNNVIKLYNNLIEVTPANVIASNFTLAGEALYKAELQNV